MTTNPDELVERAKAELHTYQRCSKAVCEEMADRITSLQDRVAQLEEAGEAMAEQAFRKGLASGCAKGGTPLSRAEADAQWQAYRATQESKS
jgi:hypothetical protein